MSKFPNNIFLSIIPGNPGDRENGVYEEWSLAPVEGAENQGYVPALTADDVKNIFNKVRDEQIKYCATEGCYQEVADWFNNQRKEK